jgi:hypothetical protein
LQRARVLRLTAVVAEWYATTIFVILLLFLPLPHRLTADSVSWILLLTVALCSGWAADAIRRHRPAARSVAVVLGIYGALMLVWRTWQLVGIAGRFSTATTTSYLVAGSGLLALVVAMVACLMSSKPSGPLSATNRSSGVP